MSTIASLNRTLDQELVALLRGASLQCLVCGEFVLLTKESACCPECGFRLRDGKAQESGLQWDLQAG